MVWCYSMMVSSVFIIVIVIGCLRANETDLRELDVLREVHQVECEHTDPRLVVVTLHEMGNSTRAASGSTLKNDCSGNITFFTCQFVGSTIKVKAIISDLTEGEVRNFTCEAYTMSGSVPTRQDLGWITLTKLAGTTSTIQGETATYTTHYEGSSSQASQGTETCEMSSVLIVLIVVLVVSGVVFIILLILYLRARSDVTSARNKLNSTAVHNLEINCVKGDRVRSTNPYQSSRLPPPVGQAPVAPGKVSVMQYQKPLPLSSGGTLAQASDDGDDGHRALAQYHEPWGRLDSEVAGQVTTLRPNPRLCHVPGFEAPRDVTDTSRPAREDSEKQQALRQTRDKPAA